MKTTINIRLNIMSTIASFAESQGITHSQVIILLMKRVVEEVDKFENSGNMVRYQDRCVPARWHRFHLNINEYEYEYLLDLRKVLKMSVSLILAYAVKRYLHEINDIKSEIGDNYLFKKYSMYLYTINGVKILHFIWGELPEMAKYPPVLLNL